MQLWIGHIRPTAAPEPLVYTGETCSPSRRHVSAGHMVEPSLALWGISGLLTSRDARAMLRDARRAPCARLPRPAPLCPGAPLHHGGHSGLLGGGGLATVRLDTRSVAPWAPGPCAVCAHGAALALRGHRGRPQLT